MSDSHKISLLDLQVPNLSQYGKKNLELNKGASRSADSSYRRQLSDSLTKKQPASISDTKQGPESRSIDFKSDQNRTGSKKSEASTASQHRENRVQGENQQAEVRQDKNAASDETGVSAPVSENATATQELESQETSESEESIEADINTQQEIKLPGKDRGQTYSLFSSSLSEQNEGQIEQDVTTESSKIQPPANFHFAEDQSQGRLQVQVTETSSVEAIPIPEGLAELLNQQVVDTSQTDAVQEVLPVDAMVESTELNPVPQMDEVRTVQSESEESSTDSKPVSQSEEFLDIKATNEVKQAIQEHREQNSDNVVDSTSENADEAQAALQQRNLRSRNQRESESTSAETGQGQIAVNQESIQGVSEPVIEPVQPEVQSEQTDVTEVVTDKTDRKSENADQNTAEPVQNQVNPIQNTILDALSRVAAETSKTGPVSQDQLAAVDSDQSPAQQAVASQTAPIAGAQSKTAVEHPVDVKHVEQLVERIVGTVRESQATGQQLKIRLSPPELGTLQIEVSLKDGVYTAKMEVQNQRVQKIVNDNMAQLKESLAKTGVSIDRFEVQISTDSSEDQRSSNSDARSQSGSEFNSNQSSGDSGDANQSQDERSHLEESATRDDDEQSQQDHPQVTRSQGISTGNVDEIDVQI
tara:strand:+ start:125759 stop:127690 length:1932 start_codon:yes stop_codon:yes gene_type:complete